ncbi:hypothetical protein ACWOA4_08430 [Pediococcus pentosaceus]|uniref:Uncharacterized protein n=3 Tax=Pediococcus pentosaceus TaxID=1255 RepID=A0A379BRJ1_PEDPE|nr:hypothetical protein [Pediococcus pentosaceus]ASC08407.1 hypothetical protein S100194_00868 [Pediococcus pentosaceus]AXR43538.1 hypothetical protein CKK51_05215 [Pediococcus pentosaceus]KAF0349258.1 hypothetical protein GBO26_07155 [Pediococcus pentosaceus]KAF0415130.1 hypothetical protein GBO79_02075 [Pediococcus pentosaceus]KAF0468586.1 hypothetical protein GBP05_00965 [Pediococcus pentosaceus]
MNSNEKLLNTIIELADDSRPTNIDPSKVRKASTLSDMDFAQSLLSLEGSGFIELQFGSDLLTDILISTKVPTK